MRTFAPSLRRLILAALVVSVGIALLRMVRGRQPGSPTAAPKPWPDWFRRLVRRANAIAYRLGMVGGRHSPMASIEYVGRRSGTLRQTPVWAYLTDDHVLVGLPYGRDVDWARNVLAARHCRLQVHGQVYDLDEPQVRSSAECTELPGWRKRMFDSSMEHLRLRIFRVQPGTLDSVSPAEASRAHEPSADVEPVVREAVLT